MKPSIREPVLTLAVLLGGTALGAAADRPFVGLAVAALVLLVRGSLATARAYTVLRGGLTPPSGAGPLAPLTAEIVALRRRLAARVPDGPRLAVPALRRFVEIFPEAAIVLDDDLRIVALNDPAVRLLGLDPNRDRGERVDLLVRHPDFLRHLREPPDGPPLEFQPAGSDGPVRVWKLPFDEAHRLLLIRPVARERELERQERLFLSNASHELRTPVTVLFGHLELLRDHPDLPENLRPAVEAMHRESVRMNHLLRNLLELLRLDATAGRAPPPEPVAVAELLAGLEERARERGRFAVHNGEEGDAILGHGFELGVAFWNLVDNAFKFGPAGGEVRVFWRRDDGGGVFVVEDDGPGIDSEEIPRLGERFYRSPSVRAAGIEGSGLGLAIVTAILERHGARLCIESTPRVGTRVICHFPERVLVRAAATPAPRRVRGAKGGGVV